jgi:CRISPR system Cascade subunit CasD
MDAVLLRFDAPLMSFGGVMVDHVGVTRSFPACSMLAGLLANALGHDHRNAAETERLQARLRHAVRCDRPGQPLVDYHTADLSQDFLSADGWTTRGTVEGRGGGPSAKGTHIRLRHYLADARYTVALTLVPADEQPDLERIETALRTPYRPLFIGRKTCLPASPLLLGRVEAANLYEALEIAPLWAQTEIPRSGLRAWWPEGEIPRPDDSRELYITDERDWRNQIHVGRRRIREGRVMPREARHED